MHRKALWMLALCALAFLAFRELPATHHALALDADAAAVAAAQEKLLASVIQIEMVGHGWVDGGLMHRRSSQGLGTLVEDGDQRFIITHNHWSLPAAEIDRVELRNAAGVPLVVLDGPAFRSLVRYQDGGTLILAAPRPLPGISPAALGDGSELVPGDTVWLLSQEAGGATPLGVASARVHRVDATVAPALVHVRGSDAAVVAGDSGGGVWHDGRLVGNLWAVAEAPAPSTWRQWFGAETEWLPTGHILISMQPLRASSGLLTSDLAPDFSGTVDYEHGPQR